mgnify:CR=1 FL=1
MECGCGRSPTGKCIGWHKLSEEEYLEKLEEYNPVTTLPSIPQSAKERPETAISQFVCDIPLTQVRGAASE